jgi:mono/diheme cytochrome c family protein
MIRAMLLALAAAAPAAAVDFAADIQPVLNQRCVECHGEKKQKSGLRLDSAEWIAKGGKDGPVVVAGDLEKSDLFVRVSLPPGDDSIMPPKGDPLPKAQQDAIAAWIKAGAPMGGAAPAAKPEPPAPAPVVAAKTPETKPAPVPDSRKDLPPPPDTDLDALAQGAPPPDAHALETLKGFGVWSRGLTKNGALIELDYRQLRGPVTAEMLKPLEKLADNVVWLDFGGSGVTDRDLTHLRPLAKLQSLHLERTAVTDKGLAEVAGLGELRYLNLYGDKITDHGLEPLGKLAKLQTLYAAQTQITQAGADALAKAVPGVAVNLGEELPEPAKPDDEGGGKGRKKKK